MLIILEGPDCAGKSTLASRLARELELQFPRNTVTLLHKGPPESHPLDEYEWPLFDYRPQRGQHIICDRWHWGESVYPALFNRPTLMDDGVRFHIELFLRSRGALMVHVKAASRALEQCITRRGDDLVESGQGQVLNDLYNGVAEMTILPTINVDGRNATDDMIRSIIHNAGIVSNAATRLNKYVTYVGPTSPRLLLIGDVRHDVDPTDLGDPRPAFMPYQSTSGHFLANSLTRYADIRWLRTIGIVNGCDVDDLEELHHMLGKPTSVALGRKAAKKAPWASWSVHHPQFVRRFRHASGAEYVNDIIRRGQLSAPDEDERL